MKKIISYIITLCLLISILASCAGNGNGQPNNNVGNTDAPANGGDGGDSGADIPTIIVPEYKDYGRGTLDFDKIVYIDHATLDVGSVIKDFNEVTDSVKKNETDVSVQIEKIRALERSYNTIDTMYTMAMIYFYKDSSAEYWQNEYELWSTSYPLFSQNVEDLLIACAGSPHKDVFERDYFGYSLDEYTDGGIYTDELVELMTEEAELEASYSSLSTANVEIRYYDVISGAISGTVDEVCEKLGEKYQIGSKQYMQAYSTVMSLYNQRLTELQKPIYIELFKIRKQIANELNYESYTEFAYENMGYDYTPDEMVRLLSDIAKCALPVSNELYQVFISSQNKSYPVDKVTLINTLSRVYERIDPKLHEAYCYMLQHGLYDIAPATSNRFDGAFTTYLHSNNSPYLFVSMTGYSLDYMTTAHEFGHFTDGYINNGESASLHLSEISSQGLEMLTLAALQGELTPDEYKAIKFNSMSSMLNNTLINQGIYSAFEHEAYKLSYDNIDEEHLEKALRTAFKSVTGQEAAASLDLSAVVIPHTVLQPFYVESYITSGIVALDLFFEEVNSPDGTHQGLEKYKALITRADSNMTFEENLLRAGIDSPFTNGKIKEIASSIYLHITGKSYQQGYDDKIGAA